MRLSPSLLELLLTVFAISAKWRLSRMRSGEVYRPRILGQWFEGIRFYAAASSPTRSPLRPPGDHHFVLRKPRGRRHAERASRGRAAQAVVAWHLPRGRQPRAPRLLLGRVHLSLQPPDLAGPGAAVLPASGTGRSDPPHPDPGVLSWRGPWSYLQEIIWPETTTCRGRLS